MKAAHSKTSPKPMFYSSTTEVTKPDFNNCPGAWAASLRPVIHKTSLSGALANGEKF
jgi:hypothetical protein